MESLLGETMSKVGDDWDIDFDAIDLDSVKDAHNKICSAIKEVHSQGTSWNMANETEKKGIEDMWGEELTKVIQDFFEGAVSAYAVTGTAALAAGLVALAFWAQLLQQRTGLSIFIQLYTASQRSYIPKQVSTKSPPTGTIYSLPFLV